MPAIQSVCPPFLCENPDRLEAFLSVMQTRGVLTRNQAHTATIALRGKLPAAVELRQRTAKSVTYVYVNGAHAYTISPRAKLSQELA